MGKKQLTTDDFITKAKAVHGDKYDYSKSIYINSETKITVICKTHGEFQMMPYVHFKGANCLKCKAKERAIPKLLPIPILLERFKKTHGDKYDYSKVKFVNTKVPVEIICKIHGSFMQEPGSHLAGRGCMQCGRFSTAAHRTYKGDELTNEFNKVHGNKYDYSRMEYTLGSKPITIICKKHGEFRQKPIIHLQGSGCQKCGKEMMYVENRANVEEIIARFNKRHNNKYQYTNVIYTGATNKVQIDCKKHGAFYQRPADHVRGIGCPKCSNGQSNGEHELFLFIQNLALNVHGRNREVVPPKELDMVIPSKKIAIEYNGIYFHSTKFATNPNKHLEKSKACEAAGYRLIHIYEDDWIHKRSVVEHTLRHILGSSNDRLHARKCTIELRDAADFFDAYHIQGAKPGKSFCLIHNNEIVAAMLFGVSTSERGNKNHSRYELIRFATKCTISGAASKLFKAFVQTNPEISSIISYSDNDMFTGNMYEKLGFTKIHETRPDYKIVIKDRRVHKANFKKSEIAKKYPEVYDPNLTEREMCEKLGFYRIYNTGLTKWEWLTPVKT